MRNRTGLRNRHRDGRGPYSRRRKAERADRYGEFDRGAQKTQDVIAGRKVGGSEVSEPQTAAGAAGRGQRDQPARRGGGSGQGQPGQPAGRRRAVRGVAA